MKLKSSINILAAAVIFLGACNSPYGTSSAKDDSVKAQESSHGSDQGGSGRTPGGDASNGTTSNTPAEGLKNPNDSNRMVDKSAGLDSMANDSSSKVKKGKKP